MRCLVTLCVAMSILALGCDPAQPSASNTTTAPAKTRIAVIPKGTTHVFWKSVEAGAKEAGEELGVEILWKGPLKEDDTTQQVALVQQFIAQKVDGIVLAPLDFKALVNPVREAMQRGIPVVIFDSPLEGAAGSDFVSLVATNNHQGGKLGGQKLAELLSHKGEVAMLRYKLGSASTDAREAGFLEAMKAHADLKVIVDNRYGGATSGEAKTTSLNMLDQLRAAAGVFACNESTTLGMLLALEQEGLAGKIRFVGFDASPPLVEALQKGHIDALVVQNPRKMGYEGVVTLVKHMRGESVAAEVDTGVAVVTQQGLRDPATRALVGLE